MKNIIDKLKELATNKNVSIAYGSDYSTQSKDLRTVSDNGQVKKVEKKDVYKSMLDLD